MLYHGGCATEFVAERRVGHRLRIFGFSCVHYGDAGHDADLWKEFLTEVESTPNAIVFGLGDYLDWLRTTKRIALHNTFNEQDSARAQYDDMLMHQLVYPFVDSVRKHCPSFKDKCLGLVEGNHYGSLMSNQFANGRTTTEEIAQLLGVRYLGLSEWIRITCYRSMGKAKMGFGQNLNVLLNHSTSTSGKLAPSLAAAERRIEGWRGVDVFLSANDHQLGHMVRQEIGCPKRGTPRQVMYEQVVGKVGSFQRGYRPGAESSNYVEKKFLKPSHLGWLSFDSHLYYRELTNAQKQAQGRDSSNEVWRFTNFNV